MRKAIVDRSYAAMPPVSAECLDERAMALGEYRPIDLADEKQHLGEMVVIIIDRKDWQLHPYWHFQSLVAAA